jgi:circadian clock protein KaiB
MKNRVELSLYVNGMNTNSNSIYARLTKHCDDVFAGNYSLNLFDVKKDPGAAEKHRIIATPTLVRDYPFPQIRVTGNLTDIRKVMLTLKLLSGK